MKCIPIIEIEALTQNKEKHLFPCARKYYKVFSTALASKSKQQIEKALMIKARFKKTSWKIDMTLRESFNKLRKMWGKELFVL